MGKKESTLTLKFRGMEAEILDDMVESGLFSTKSEAVRSALVKYAADIGLLRRKDLWAKIDMVKRRKVSAAQLERELRRL